jgi:hypothetical protein
MAGHIASAGSVGWCTPPEILDPVYEVLGEIGLDPCSNENSLVKSHRRWSLPADDALDGRRWEVQDGPNTMFMNPPFGVTMMNLVERAAYSAKEFAALFPEGDKHEQARARAVARADRATWRTDTIEDWVWRQANAWNDNHLESISILPNSIDTGMWHGIIYPEARAICVLRGRSAFLELVEGVLTPCGQPPMGCSMVYYGPDPRRFKSAFASLGHVETLR